MAGQMKQLSRQAEEVVNASDGTVFLVAKETPRRSVTRTFVDLLREMGASDELLEFAELEAANDEAEAADRLGAGK
jgi:hypothetical protein